MTLPNRPKYLISYYYYFILFNNLRGKTKRGQLKDKWSCMNPREDQIGRALA